MCKKSIGKNILRLLPDKNNNRRYLKTTYMHFPAMEVRDNFRNWNLQY